MIKEKNETNSDMATLCLVLGIFIPVVACILVQDKINSLCTTTVVHSPSEESYFMSSDAAFASNTATEERPVANANPYVSNNLFDDLIKFKELYDNGVITQEEFEAKKKQLLNI